MDHSPHTGTRRFPIDPWKITENVFKPDDYKLIEAVMALSNGYLGQRASFEEGASRVDSLRGNYVAGVFDAYPNPSMIKLKGRPANPSEMVNIPDHLPVLVKINGESLDLSKCTIDSYSRTLHMDTGILTRDIVCRMQEGERVRVSFARFLSRVRRHLAATQVTVTPLDADARVDFISIINGDVANVNHRHLKDCTLHTPHERRVHGLTCTTRSTGIQIAVLAAGAVSGPKASVVRDNDPATKRSRLVFSAKCAKEQPVTFEKIVAVATSRDTEGNGGVMRWWGDGVSEKNGGVMGRWGDGVNDNTTPPPYHPTAPPVLAVCEAFLEEGRPGGFAALLKEHEQAWADVWKAVEIDIAESVTPPPHQPLTPPPHQPITPPMQGDLTQGLHYALFQMIQNAPTDASANIGAKGLTGEHYFGTYFWDTEVFMLPMFGFVMPDVARNLVQSRVAMLPGARRKAQEMGLEGAAYPFMSDADGNESCTLWQFGLLGIHVTADVAWGLWFYYCVSGDLDFIAAGGIDVMVETGRFWLSRVFFRRDIGKFVINRVLGPDEYHQGVDNSFYTNIMAQESLLKTCQLLDVLKSEKPAEYDAAVERLGLADEEIERFRAVGQDMFLPRDAAIGVNLQDDRFHLLEPWDLTTRPLSAAVNVVWSYDRAMRTQLLRQGDVVVAHVLVGDRFTPDDMRRDFDYYEPKTTHDSSLSFCSHSVVAAKLKKAEMAYDYFLRTARLDIDDIHGNTWMGMHTACLGGAWQCVVLGFGGVRWYDGVLSVDPLLPAQWDAFSFSIWWHGIRVKVAVRDGEVELQTDGRELELLLGGRKISVGPTAAKFTRTTRA